MSRPSTNWRRPLLLTAIALAALVALWTWWAEGHPRDERQLRLLVHDRLQAWLPEAMAPSRDDWHGLFQRSIGRSASEPGVLLVHGLDEPGIIWDDLIPALAGRGIAVWELRYPNDQGIDRSADYLAGLWSQLPPERPIVLIGHSMGGLVIRDFVTRWRLPADRSPRVEGAPVRGLILVGTPNHGSEWARLRIWLELRESLVDLGQRRFSLMAALRDGIGEAKIDLRPGSDFLSDLSARPWPADCPIRLIGGELLEPSATMSRSLAAISDEIHSPELGARLADWWSTLGDRLGDGVVTSASLELDGAPPPILLRASHRGLLERPHRDAPEPPAIGPILQILADWGLGSSSPSEPGDGPSAPARRFQSR